jgi:hypothetical protein
MARCEYVSKSHKVLERARGVLSYLVSGGIHLVCASIIFSQDKFHSNSPTLLIEIRFKSRLYIPYSVELQLTILDELHKKPYSGHLGYQKMVTALRKLFYWPNMKGDTAEYLSKCLDCQ